MTKWQNPAARVGFRGYAKLLHIVATNPGSTTAEIGEKWGRTSEAALTILCEFRSCRIVRREYQKTDYGRCYRWWIGAEDDVRGERGIIARPRANIITIASVLKALQTGIGCTELADEMGQSQSVMRRTLASLREPGQRLVRICRWDKRHGPAIPIYQFDPLKEDAKRPPRKNRNTINQEWRARARAKREQLRMLHAIAGNASIFRVAA